MQREEPGLLGFPLAGWAGRQLFNVFILISSYFFHCSIFWAVLGHEGNGTYYTKYHHHHLAGAGRKPTGWANLGVFTKVQFI